MTGNKQYQPLPEQATEDLSALAAVALVQTLIGAQRAINSMKAEAETAAQGDEQMMFNACEQISNEGLEASLAIQAALSTAAQPPTGIWVPTELAQRVQETMGEFLMDHGWRQQDMDTSDEFGALLAATFRHP